MSTTWERLSGDTSAFAFKMAFHRDPDSDAFSSPELSLSWGSFEVWAGGVNLCAHLEEGEAVDACHWHLLPLLEWLAESWDFLFHEERLPARNRGPDAWSSLYQTRFPPPSLDVHATEKWETDWHAWWSRHCLLAGREGGAFPNMIFRRWRHLIEVSWGPGPVPGAPEGFGFLSRSGYYRGEPEAVAEPIYDVMRQATDYLRDQIPESERLRILKTGIARIERGARERRLALLAGLGTSADRALAAWRRVRRNFRGASDEVRSAVFDIAAGDKLVLRGSCQAGMMFGSVSPNISQTDIVTLAESLINLYSENGDPAKLRRHVVTRPIHGSPESAWSQGYALAQDLVEELGLVDGSPFVDLAKVLRRLAITEANISLNDDGIRAVAIAGPHHAPAVLINDQSEANSTAQSRRFTIAHELCHILYDRDYARQLAMASGPWAPRDVERRANAFAAMLLMPPQLVGRALGQVSEPIETTDQVRTLGEILQTSPTATLEHLHNLGVISDSTRAVLRGPRTEEDID